MRSVVALSLVLACAACSPSNAAEPSDGAVNGFCFAPTTTGTAYVDACTDAVIVLCDPGSSPAPARGCVLRFRAGDDIRYGDDLYCCPVLPVGDASTDG
jgi:hypothetical protein